MRQQRTTIRGLFFEYTFWLPDQSISHLKFLTDARLVSPGSNRLSKPTPLAYRRRASRAGESDQRVVRASGSSVVAEVGVGPQQP